MALAPAEPIGHEFGAQSLRHRHGLAAGRVRLTSMRSLPGTGRNSACGVESITGPAPAAPPRPLPARRRRTGRYAPPSRCAPRHIRACRPADRRSRRARLRGARRCPSPPRRGCHPRAVLAQGLHDEGVGHAVPGLAQGLAGEQARVCSVSSSLPAVSAICRASSRSVMSWDQPAPRSVPPPPPGSCLVVSMRISGCSGGS